MSAASALLAPFVQGLSSPVASTKDECLRQLRHAIEEERRDMVPSMLRHLIDDLFQLGTKHLQSAESSNKIAGLGLMECLLDLSDENKVMRRVEYARELRDVLENDKKADYNRTVMELAAKSLGYLARVGGSSLMGFMQTHYLDAALGTWIKDNRYEVRRYAAVLILKELALCTPTLVYDARKQIFEEIWTVINDQRQWIREQAAEALGACLQLIGERESTDDYCRRALSKVEEGLFRDTPERIHGSFLTMQQLFKHPGDNEFSLMRRNPGDFMENKYREFCAAVIAKKDHRDRTIRDTVVKLMPQLAAFDVPLFQRCRHLNTAQELLLSYIRTQRDPAVAYIALGELAVAIGTDIARPAAMLDEIMSAISKGLSRSEGGFCQEALLALKMIIEVVAKADKEAGVAAGGDDQLGDGTDGTGGSGTRRRRSSTSAGQTLILTLEKYLGRNQPPHDQTLMDMMFNGGLSDALMNTLNVLVDEIPGTNGQVQHRLLAEITRTLGSPVGEDRLDLRGSTMAIHNAAAYPGTRGSSSSLFARPSNMLRHETSSSPKTPPWGALGRLLPSNSGPGEGEGITPEQLTLALSILGTFDFYTRQGGGRTQLLVLLRDGVVGFLDNEYPAIRKAAAVTCCRLLDHGPSPTTALIIGEILERLLMVGTADSNSEIRVQVLASLKPGLDAYLSQADSLHCLFEALNDECFPVREEAMTIIARLTHRNPALVMPLVRRTLVQLLRDLEFSGDAHSIKESALLLKHLVKGANKLVYPYVMPILQPLVLRLRDSSVVVVTAILQLLGELSLVAGTDLLPHQDRLVPGIIEALNDPTSALKQSVAMRALGQVVNSTGIVFTPYLQYPYLLDGVLAALQRGDQGAKQLRCEAIRTVGILGCLDPRLKDNLQSLRFNAHSRQVKAVTRAGSGYVSLVIEGDSDLFSQANDRSVGTPTDRREPGSRQPTRDDAIAASQKSAGSDIDRQRMPTEEYIPAVTISALMQILGDPEAAPDYLMTCIHAIMNIFKVLGRRRCVPHLKPLVNGFLDAIRRPHLRGKLFEAMCMLIGIANEHIQEYLPIIINVINQHWNPHLANVLELVETIHSAVGGTVFQLYLPDLLPRMLGVIRTERGSPQRQNTQRVLRTLRKLRRSIREYLRLVVPVLLKVVEQPDADFAARREALNVLLHVTKGSHISDFASRIVQPLLRLVASPEENLKNLGLQSLCTMVRRLGPEYVLFVPTAQRQVCRNPTNPYKVHYDLLVSKVLKNQPLPPDDGDEGDDAEDVREIAFEGSHDRTIMPDGALKSLSEAWDVSPRMTTTDWTEWMRRLSVELLRRSPSPMLRYCYALALENEELARELFNAGFIAVWDVIHEDALAEESLISAFEKALKSSQLPSRIRQALLNLAEFMDLDDKILPVDIYLLGVQAEKAHAFAKCLHYKEMEFNSSLNSDASPNAECIEALISMNNQLGLPLAAAGILQFSELKFDDVSVRPLWLEKLGRWSDALEKYESTSHRRPRLDNAGIDESQDGVEAKAEEEDGGDAYVDASLGKLRCLYALGEWEELANKASDLSKTLDECGLDLRQRTLGRAQSQVRVLGAKAAWNRKNWKEFQKYVQRPAGTEEKQQSAFEDDSLLFDAVLAIKDGDFTAAQIHIDSARETIAPVLQSLLGESYSRAYKCLVTVQQLAELEEIVEYKAIQQRETDLEGHQESIAHLAHMRNKWKHRLKCVPRDIEVWRRLLAVRSIVVEPIEDVATWLKVASLCRKNRMMTPCANILRSLGAHIPHTGPVSGDSWAAVGAASAVACPPPQVHFAKFKFMWSSGDRQAAFDELQAFLGNAVAGGSIGKAIAPLIVRCYLKAGEWQTKLHEDDLTAGVLTQVLENLRRATELGDSSYNAWHTWALMNFRMSSGSIAESDGSDVDKEHHVVRAVHGFFKSISLGNDQPAASVLQDVLRLLTLWFDNGHLDSVHREMVAGFDSMSVDTWLGVVPQLIARIHTQSCTNMNTLMQRLLVRLGQEHPQALIYPITVASKTSQESRRQAATAIKAKMREHDAELVDEADLVSQEIIRAAITWHEMWHEGLEEASKLYFGDNDIDGMLTTLEKLHVQMDGVGDGGAQRICADTLRTVSFQHSFGRDLQEALEWLNRFKATRDEVDLHQAWDLYYHVYHKTSKQLNNLNKLELQHVAPSLLEANDLKLAIPGTYRAGPSEEVVRIHSFAPSVEVISSKQRPRKITIYGSDGKGYVFLLKGHEDLRQDERVMQLFGLINGLLANDRDTNRFNLSICRYDVMPLSNDSGLIGWVPHSDTLHSLIKDYREERKIKVNVEHRLLQQMSADYEKLTLMQKVEVFEYARERTTGQDLAKVLWLKSQNSEVWLDRRSNYTRSLAVMSMAGHILGLGDRHPSNLMLDRYTGRIVHIDFGDCFEVAIDRDKWPEKVPFRLTRMLVNAMEVSGIEGNFRLTCERVMRVVRENGDSVMAMLEAFVYDPLINWWAHKAAPRTYSGGDSDEEDDSSEDEDDRRSKGAPLADSTEAAAGAAGAGNTRAVEVVRRINDKVTGREFGESAPVKEQVGRLIEQATSVENLCQMYMGWCPFW